MSGCELLWPLHERLSQTRSRLYVLHDLLTRALMQSFPESWEDKQYVVIQKRIINVCCTYCVIIHCEIYLGPKSVGPIRNTPPPPTVRGDALKY